MAKAKKETKKEKTVIIKLEATFVVKGNDEVDMTNLCPEADHVDIKDIKVFERE